MMQPFIVRLPDEEKKLLELEAKKKGVATAVIARKAIAAYFEKINIEKNNVALLLRWEKKAEKYKSNNKKTDISKNYKDYLYGKKSKKFE